MLSLLGKLSFGQEKIVRYFDKNWIPTDSTKATYYAEFVKKEEVYECRSYWLRSNSLCGESTFADTTFEKPLGTQRRFFENGKLEDSVLYKNGLVAEHFHYYKNGKLQVHYKNRDDQKPLVEAFDASGNVDKEFIYEKDATFKGGDHAWFNYLKKNTTSDFSKIATPGNEEINATVQVQFIINEFGVVITPKIYKSSGFDYLDKDALRVIGTSPIWNNAISMNKPIKVYRIQPVTYILTPSKKKSKS